MFDTILQLPLFQGISTESLTKILDKAILHFEKKEAGEVIIERGTQCNSLVYILRGEVEKSTEGMGESPYEVSEFMTGPYLIEPNSMFGLDTFFKSTYIAHTDVDMMSVSKEFMNSILLKDDVFLLNYINILCRRTQVLEDKIWAFPHPNATSILCEVMLSHFESQTGRKSLYINVEDLAFKSNVLRSKVKQILKNLEQRGLLQLSGRSIDIPDASLLADYSRSIIEGGQDDMS